MSWSDSAANLAAEREVVASAARRTLPALLAGGISYLLSSVTSAIIFNDIFHQARGADLLDATAGNPDALELSDAANRASTLSNIAQIGILVVGVLFVIWFYKAVQFSEHVGLHQRRSTGWAIAGWIVPIVNFWFPYQATKDMVPPGNERIIELIRSWWGLWIAMSLSGVLVLIGSYIDAAAGYGMAVVAAALTIGATLRAQQVVAAVDDAQRRYLDQLTQP
jgi:Domain of unknown function (DUF4328)